ncbi:PH domain-containing protein [Corynebacterium spheniscorum]|uniref:PH domain-containing protein n=1 Tax=Corynebacterium spheniscorum TaxID=185761 RepID=A0A1I2PT58_9CORY|nr:PH domain-containing protein [Corynebacterium spheniscorum]KAA8723440.1 PH domain-containing protein [Corynebacterium spheniscorum]SFG19234.1 PH domain-containing protein [Corynebacterium spheniscorum]
MAPPKLETGESLQVDLSAPLSRLLYPAMELVLWTGLCWIALGWLFQQGSPELHRTLVLILWLVLVAWRFLLPYIHNRREIFRVTDHRIITRGGKLGTRMESIPLEWISAVRRKRSTVYIWIINRPQPLAFYRVPKAKAVCERISSLTGVGTP